MTKRFRLNDNHPVMQKLNEAFDCLDRLGLTLDYSPYHGYIALVKGDPNTYYIEDAEDSSPASSGPLPPMIEYKVIYHKEVKA